MARRIRAMHPLLRRRYLNRCAQVAAASGASRSSSSSSSLLRSSRNRFLTSEEQQMRRMRQQLRRRRKRQYFVLSRDAFEALPLFAEFRMVERYAENLEKRKIERVRAKEREREAMNERREERRIRELIKMRKILKHASDRDNSFNENEYKAKSEENEKFALVTRDSLKEPKLNEETECLSDSSIISDEEERRAKRHKQREKRRLMRRYYQALELQRDSVVNEVLLMVKPNLLFSPALIDKSIKRPGINVSASKMRGMVKKMRKKRKKRKLL
ncbi:uncharacterized protein MONOS_16334 [Monocercomonoides exilis]|uniref:uncharacterized protein n=1 Tax=Monocercomonoides exilis TaxID=2049356 RepID=UPI0035594049|nr:hypothetical protein MONOS_16334 [Monocercomonoides exilis]|eukprot:MONOS_16334.1-p1 / transcript=MONOS_16334.1 / gene=MONOS_16334 / organism=Monocercomonoides_exilis_PA203 / gene_product=unspecified product / transcript_product=unspecified product / location=Mono_scaffold01654:3211-4026(-) / protein_length=272 / sequence_SO=supercontig / SO=protein_coding / is_pseudo=false